MATLTITLTSGPVNGTRTFTVSDADITTLITYMQNKFSGRGPGGQGGSPLTAQQALIAWVQDWINRTVGEIQTVQTQQVVPNPLSFT